MDAIRPARIKPSVWLARSVLAAHVDAFAARLQRGRYSKHVKQAYTAAIAHLARWMMQCCLPLARLDESGIELFLRRHVSHCDCPRPVIRDRATIRAAAGHLLAVLRERGAIAPPARPAGPVEDELHRYDLYLREVRGLTEGTRSGQLRMVRKLLSYKFAVGPVAVAQLQPEELREFINQQLELRTTASNAATLTSALRMYLRYRATRGDRVHALVGVIASPAQWSLAMLPRALTRSQVNQLLRSFTSGLPAPRRGYAIVRCALDLGLRSGEVARLELGDIDWRAGTVTLKHTKSHRQDILPLPLRTGRALAEYLRNERPKSTDRSVFVRRIAPHGQPIGVDAIRRVIRDAYRRIGLPHGRTHALRHTLACQLLERGGSLKEVADVLRHRSLNTSLIYAKLDHRRLSAVALPWPGSKP